MAAGRDSPNRSLRGPRVAGLAAVANALTDAGQEVEDLSLRQPTLDEVFLTLTGLPMESDDHRTLEETRS